MISVNVKVTGDLAVTNKFNKMENTSKDLLQSTCLELGTRVFRLIQSTIPVFSGDAKENVEMRKLPPTKRVCVFQILFDKVVDPNYGHNYTWYMENGRSSISGKIRTGAGGSPKPGMRYWAVPPQSNNNPNKIFRYSVAGAQPTYFIRNAVNSGRAMVPEIASRSVSAWAK